MLRALGDFSCGEGYVDLSFREPERWATMSTANSRVAGTAVSSTAVTFGDPRSGPVLLCLALAPGVRPPDAPPHGHASDTWRMSLLGNLPMGPDSYDAGEFRFQQSWKPYASDNYANGPEGGWSALPVVLVRTITEVLAQTGVDNPKLHRQVMRRLDEERDNIRDRLARRLVGSEVPHPTARVAANITDVTDLVIDLTGVTVGGAEDDVALVQLSIGFTASLTARVLGDASPRTIEALIRTLATSTFREGAAFETVDVVLPGVREIPELSVLDRVTAPLLLGLDDMLKPHRTQLADMAKAVSAQQRKTFSEIVETLPRFTPAQSEAIGAAMLSSELADAIQSAREEVGKVFAAYGGELAFRGYLRQALRQVHQTDEVTSHSDDEDSSSDSSGGGQVSE